MKNKEYYVCVLAGPTREWHSRFVGVTTNPQRWYRNYH